MSNLRSCAEPRASKQAWFLFQAVGLMLSLSASGACRTVHSHQSSTPRSARPPRENAAIRDLRSIAASDLSCTDNAIEVSKEGTIYGVAGCGKRTNYRHERDGRRRWTRVGSIDARVNVAPRFNATKTANGQTTLSLELPHQNTDIVIKLVARPAVYRDRALLSFERVLTLSSMAECEAHVSAGDTPLALPPSTFRREGLLESRLVEVRMEDVVALAKAEHAVADLCGKRVPLVEADFVKLREFVARFDAEFALAGGAAPTPAAKADPIAAPSNPITVEDPPAGAE